MTSSTPSIDSVIPRPPVVGIFGHIDHGKSTLLDYIRKTNIVAKEAGGITQHIGAYEVARQREDGHLSRITFLDTPGHEAFSNIRTSGADAADIAILVVSGEDGVKPQTLEVYKHIKASSIPYIVAITKMDKPAADIERTKQNLAESGIYVEGYGGDITSVPVSAKTGDGIEDLLDMISLQADLLDLKGEPETLGTGIIIESRMDPKRGVSATAIIKNGTVRSGTFAASGEALAPLRFLLDADGKNAEELAFSSPIQIVGWDKLPEVGTEFRTFLKKDDAVLFIEENKNAKKTKTAGRAEMAEGVSGLTIIIKADTAGSLQAVENELKKLSRERIVPQITSSGVGSINEKDVKSAIATPGTLIFGFHTKVDSSAASLAERSGVLIETYTIIYELTDKVKALLEEKEPRIEVEEITGSAKILKLFGATKTKQVLGARMLTGKFSLGGTLKIMRRETEIGKGALKELQQSKVAVQEVLEGTEFGAMVDSKIELAPGDVLEAVTRVTK